MTKIIIYGLTDPVTNQLRYIGKSVNVKKRLYMHLYNAKTKREDNYKSRWLRKLLSAGLKPNVVVLTETDLLNWQSTERELIAKHKESLTNTSAGGEGVDAPRTEEWKKRISLAHKGKKLSEEFKQKMRERNLAKRGTHCRNGHLWNENTIVEICGNNGFPYRGCRICRNARSRVYSQKRRDLKRQLNPNPIRKAKALLTHCKKGHLLADDNVKITFRRGINERVCRICLRERNRKAKKISVLRAKSRTEPPKHKNSTHCKNGHEFNELNTGYDLCGYRFCKECNRNYNRKSKLKCQNARAELAS